MANTDPPRVRSSTTRGGSSGNFALVSKEVKTARRTSSRCEEADRVGIAQRRGLRVREAEDETEQAAGHEEQAGQVQGIVVGTPVAIKPEQRADEGAGHEDEVDEERPPPRGVGGENAAEEESQRPARAGEGTIDPEGPSSLLRIGERRGQQGQHRGREQGPECALDGPGNHEHREVDRGTADR